MLFLFIFVARAGAVAIIHFQKDKCGRETASSSAWHSASPTVPGNVSFFFSIV